jgi:hypothetical protein
LGINQSFITSYEEQQKIHSDVHVKKNGMFVQYFSVILHTFIVILHMDCVCMEEPLTMLNLNWDEHVKNQFRNLGILTV